MTTVRALHAWADMHGRVVLLALALALSSCATKTSTTHLWSAEDYSAAPLRRVVVFGRGMAEPQRREVEDQMVAALGAHAVTATPSYRLFPVLPNREIAQAELAKQGFDGAFVTTLHGVRERQSYVPGHYHGGGFWGGYYGGMGWGWSPGYIVTDELVDAETVVFDLRSDGGRLVWSATTRTTNPRSGEDFTKSVTRETLPDIAKRGIIPRED